MILKLTLTVDYDCVNGERLALLENLAEVAESAYREGRLTGSYESEVNEWSYTVEEQTK